MPAPQGRLPTVRQLTQRPTIAPTRRRPLRAATIPIRPVTEPRNANEKTQSEHQPCHIRPSIEGLPLCSEPTVPVPTSIRLGCAEYRHLRSVSGPAAWVLAQTSGF